LGILWARSGSFEFDANGDPAEGAEAFFFNSGTSTPRAVYSDSSLSTPHEHPVEADGNGRWPAVYLPYGDYKIILKTAGGTTLFTADGISNDEPFDESFEVDETAQYNTGDFILAGKNGTRTGAVRCNGRSIGNAASGATERANADCEDLFAYLWDNYRDAEAAVSGGRGATAAADFAANKRISLPDLRGGHIVGFGDMGNTDSARLSAAPITGTGSGLLAGSQLGANTHTLTEAQIAAHTHTFSATTGADGAHTHTYSGTTSSDGAHTHTINITDPGHVHPGNLLTNGNAQPTGGMAVAVAGGSNYDTGSATTGITAASVSNGAHTHTYSGTTSAISATHTHTVSGTTGSTGSGTAHNNLSFCIPATILMKL
jgi:microcystin-dependent protein